MGRIGFLLLLVFFSFRAQAVDDVEFKNSGELRIRYFNDLNSTGQDAAGQRSDATGRFKWNLGARRSESLQAYLSVIHNSTFGTQGTATGDYSTSSSNNLLVVNRAWGWWKATESLSLKAGRLGLEIGDGSIFSENDWEAYPTAHEGIAASWDWEFARLVILGAKTHEFRTDFSTATHPGNPSSDPERNIYVISADIKNVPEMVRLANIHFVQYRKDATDLAPFDPADPTNPANLPAGVVNGSENFYQYGLTIGGDAVGVLYKVTASFQSGIYEQARGDQGKINASMYDVLLGYSLPDTMGLKVSAGYHADTGDDAGADQKQYQPYYYDRHNYAGLMDVLEWGNLSYWNVNASFLPTEDLEVGAGYYMFSRSSVDAPAILGERYRGIITTGLAQTEKSLGSEIDIFANKSYDNGGIKFGGRLGAFLPGEYFEKASPARDKTLIQAMVQGSIAF